MPEFCKSVMELFCLRSLSISKLKLNYHVDTGCARLPASSERVIPIWMTFRMSTLDLILKYSLLYIVFKNL